MNSRVLAVALVLLAMPRPAAGAPCPPRAQLYPSAEFGPLDDPSARVVLEDFNRDGILDMVTGGKGKRVTVRLGHIAGGRVGFSQPVFVPADSTPLGFTAADLNGDQVPDLVIAIRDRNRLAVVLGSGRGNSWFLRSAVEYPTLAAPVGVAAGDFNGDGVPDLVVSNTLANSLSAFLGRGDGRLGERSDYPIDGKPGEIEVADVNQDGMLDVVVANSTLRGITVLLNNGGSGMSAGLFRDYVNNPIGSATAFNQPVSLRLADFDSDGVLDCVGSYAATGSLDVMRGLLFAGGYRLFNVTRLQGFGGSPVYDNPRGITVGDFDRDGHLDIASAYSGPQRIQVYYGDGNMGFTSSFAFPGPDQPTDVESADLDGDGSLDLVAVGLSGTYSISWGSCEGPAPTITGFEPMAGAVGDSVVVRGTSLKLVTRAFINGVEAAIVGRAVSTLTLRVPAGALSGTIALEGASGTGTSSSVFVIGEKPQVLAATPDRAKVGQIVTLSGRWLTGTDEVRFGTGGAASFEVMADSVLQAVVDTSARSGSISVTTLIGTGTSAFVFTVLPPDTFPHLDAVRDVPDDEGGRVFVEWTASEVDVPGRGFITAYHVLRRRVVSTAAARANPTASTMARGAARPDDVEWELVASIPASGLTSYSVVAPTHNDSTTAGIPYETFVVHALTADSTTVYGSMPDSGYSVDNRAPPQPVGFAGKTVGSSVVLRWNPSVAADIAFHRIYRGSPPDFIADSSRFIAEVYDTTYTDETPGKKPLYKLVAMDVHGNPGEAAIAIPDVLTPTLLSLVQAEVRPGYVRLVWHGAAMANEQATLMRATAEADWSAIAQLNADAGGRFVAEDHRAPSGAVRYQLRARSGAGAWASDIETVAVPHAAFALGVPWPHPVQNTLRVTVSLPLPGGAMLEVMDITGRRVARRALNLSAGESTIEIPEAARLTAGIYHMRLTQGPRSATRRVAVVR